MEMKLIALKLEFDSGMHLGTREGSLEGTDHFIHSDTLYSAFFHGFRLLYGQEGLEVVINRFLEGNPPFGISSAFPFWDGILYFPTPKNQVPSDKETKKISFWDSRSWSNLISGQNLQDVIEKVGVQTIPRGSDKPDSDQKEPWNFIDAPRVGLDRLTNHPGERYFHCGEVHYVPGSGLYFIVDMKDQQFQKHFEAVWRVLADEGLGGDRTVGKGQFKYPSFEEFCLEVPEDATGVVSLSLYYPTIEERTGFNKSAYDFLERKGYIFSPEGRNLRRKKVSMLTEGSVFSTPPIRKGALVEVTPSIFKAHRVYRSGIFFGLPCIL